MRTSGILETRAARTDTAIDRVSRNSFEGQSDWRSLTLVEIGLLHYHHNGSREIEVWNCILFQSGFARTIGVSLPFQFSDPYIQRSTSEFATLFIIYLLYFCRDELIFCARGRRDSVGFDERIYRKKIVLLRKLKERTEKVQGCKQLRRDSNDKIGTERRMKF